MAIKPCRECGKDVSSEADKCPHCGIAKPAGGGTSVSGGFCGCLIIAFMVLYLIGTCSTATRTDAERAADAERDVAISARIVCEAQVKARLKAPATANFVREGREYGPAASDASGKTWIVRGNVDAQNGFGALIRNRYQCTLRHTGGDRFDIVEVLVL